MNNRKTIGKLANSRVTWERKPMTQVVNSKKAYSRKKKHKTKEEF